MAAKHLPEYEAALQQPFSETTERCGGERAELSGTLRMFDPRLGQPPPGSPLAVIVDWSFKMWDGDDDDESVNDSQSGQTIVQPGTTGRITPSLRDGDVPPDRAHAEIWVDNYVNPA
jgi:hypothetical protein